MEQLTKLICDTEAFKSLKKQFEQNAFSHAYLVSGQDPLLLKKFLVFATEGNHWREYFKSTAILGWSYLLNSLLLWILVGKMLLNPYAAQALVLSVLTLFNFVLFKHFAFKTQKVHFWEKIYAVFD